MRKTDDDDVVPLYDRAMALLQDVSAEEVDEDLDEIVQRLEPAAT